MCCARWFRSCPMVRSVFLVRRDIATRVGFVRVVVATPTTHKARESALYLTTRLRRGPPASSRGMTAQASAQEPAAAAAAPKVSVADGIKDVMRRIEEASQRSGNKRTRWWPWGRRNPWRPCSRYQVGHRSWRELRPGDSGKGCKAPEDIKWHFIVTSSRTRPRRSCREFRT